MPELPDVEIFKRYLDATSLQKDIKTVEITSEEMLKGISGKRLKRLLEGKRFTTSRRHGKYLFAGLGKDGWLMLHFGMTGFLKYFKDPEKKPAHVRLQLNFSNGFHLAYDCMRKLGRIGYTPDPREFIRKKGLGPDAMDPGLDLDTFNKILSRPRGTIKGTLLNQAVLAGIGNIYADEILFQAGIHPRADVGRLNAEALEALFRAMRDDVLPTAIDRGANPSRFPVDYIIPKRHNKGNCPKCGTPLQTIKVSGRTTYLCPGCQHRQ